MSSIRMNGSRLLLPIAAMIVAAVAGWGCAEEVGDPLNSGIVTNEPLISDSHESDEAGQRASSAEESPEAGSSSKAGSAPHPTPLSTEDLPEGVSPALAMDAQWYAKQYGVDLEEAINRLTLQDTIGELGAEIESKEADTLAGFWIQHKPEYRVVVAFTRDGESTIAKYVQEGPLAELIEVRTAEATLRDLERAQLEAGRIVADLGFSAASGIDVKENRVEIYTQNRAGLEEALRESEKMLPDHVVIIGQ